MHRSQIMLKEEQYAYLVSQAQRQGKTISQVVRELRLSGSHAAAEYRRSTLTGCPLPADGCASLALIPLCVTHPGLLSPAVMQKSSSVL
jgi:hypothetical protein